VVSDLGGNRQAAAETRYLHTRLLSLPLWIDCTPLQPALLVGLAIAGQFVGLIDCLPPQRRWSNRYEYP
jgi:hypothetical protein